MTRATLLSVLVPVALASAGSAQVFRGGADLVRVPVVVLDAHGVPVRGLSRGDFEVIEDGRPQPLVFFAAGPAGPDVPLHLGLMLDRSESMTLDLAATSTAAIRFVDEMDGAADVTLVEFDASVRISRFSPSDYPRLFARLRGAAAGGDTALYDAIARYVETTRDRPGQHVLLIYTDGGDSALGLTAADVERLLRESDVTVYVLGYVERLLGAERGRQQAILGALAHDTGGEAFFPTSARDVAADYARIRAELDGRYLLGYVPPDGARGGRVRRIEVRVGAPLARESRVRARTGYVVAGDRR